MKIKLKVYHTSLQQTQEKNKKRKKEMVKFLSDLKARHQAFVKVNL